MAAQQAFILYSTTFANDEGEVTRDSNLDQLNKLLNKGWKISMATPMSGHGEDDDETRCLVVLDKGK